MALTTVIILLILGLLLILVEVFVIPGIGIAGIGGVILMIAGIIMGYVQLGPKTGHIILLSSGTITFGMFYLFFKQKTWNKIGLNQSISSRVNEIDLDLKVGDKGKSISRLAPMGRALINEINYEVQSYSGYIDPHDMIEVVQIKNNKIIVKKI